MTLSIIVDNILILSKQASIIFAVIFIFRVILWKMPKKYLYYLWIFVFFRLIRPSLFSSRLSIFRSNSLFDFGEIGTFAKIKESTTNSILDVINDPILLSGNLKNKFFDFLWLIVVSIILLVYIFIIIRIIFSTRFAIKYKNYNNVYMLDGIDVPFSFGLFCPKIYLPIYISEDDAHIAILHEKTHIQRKDCFIKIVSTLLLIINWFNPFIWVAYIMQSNDMELSCDEITIQKYNIDIYEYGELLLRYNGRHYLNVVNFSGRSIKVRIKNILNLSKNNNTFIFLLICFFVIPFFSNEYIENNKYFSIANDFDVVSPIANSRVSIDIDKSRNDTTVCISENINDNSIVYPCNSGVICKIEKQKDGYKNIYIEHKNGYQSIYYRMSEIYVVENEEVSLNTIIGITKSNLFKDSSIELCIKNGDGFYADNISTVIKKRNYYAEY